MEKEQLTFAPFNSGVKTELNNWHEQEKMKGGNGFDQFVVLKGTQLGDYVEYVDSEIKNIVCNLAYINEQLVGFLCYSSPEEDHVHVEIMGVNPDLRGQGIAKNMLTTFKHQMNGIGIEHITLSVNKDNTAGINSFSKVCKQTEKQPNSNYISYELV